MPNPISVADLAQAINASLVGDGSRLVDSCNSLADATPNQVALFHIAKYAKELETTKAGAIIVNPGEAKNVKRAENLPPLVLLESKNPYYAWQQAMVKLMGPRPRLPVAGTPDGTGISSLASIHPSAKLGQNVTIHPFSLISENVTIGDNTIIYPHTTIMPGSRIGADCTLFPRVTVYENCIIGDRCLIGAGTVIGSDGFAYAQANGIHHKMPQMGGLIIEDDVEIATNSMIERGALNPTTIARGTKIGSGVIIGHNCRIGPGNIIISSTCVSGSTSTGKYVVMAGQVGIAGHLDIPDFVKIGAQSGVMTNPEPNTEIVGSPAMEASHARRVYLNFMRLPELAQRLKEAEKKLAKMEPHGRRRVKNEDAKRASCTLKNIPMTYSGLAALFPLRPIHDSVDLDNATEILDAMALHHDHFSPDQADYFDVLASLVAAYEAQHDPLILPKSSPLQTLKSLVELHEMSASDLGRILGNRELGSKILSGTRKLTVNHIKKLARKFHIEPGLFI